METSASAYLFLVRETTPETYEATSDDERPACPAAVEPA